MKSMFVAVSLAVLTLAAVVPAMAEQADSATCRSLGKEASTALSGATGDVTTARREAQMGADACKFGLWENGATHYRKVLTLLGKQ